MNFPKNCPFEDCSFWNFSGMAQFSVLTYFHYFGFFGIILSRSMRENSVILNISPFGCTSLSNSCIWSFCHFCPMHNFLLWLIWKIQLFLAILEKILSENHASVLFCHFGIHSSKAISPLHTLIKDITIFPHPVNKSIEINLDSIMICVSNLKFWIRNIYLVFFIQGVQYWNVPFEIAPVAKRLNIMTSSDTF